MKKEIFYTFIFNILFINQSILPVASGYFYDVLIIGAGAAGLSAAMTANKLGRRVIIFENERFGGGKLWSGDLPFKTLFKIADTVHNKEILEREGLVANPSLPINTSEILPHIRKLQEQIYKNLITPERFQEHGINLVIAPGYLEDAHTMRIIGNKITAEYVIIATGSKPRKPAIEGIDTIDYLNCKNFFLQETLPDSLLIIGGGPLGIEMASGLNRLGVKITVIMKHGTVLPTYDHEMVAHLTNILIDEGVEIYCDMNTTKITQDQDGIHLLCHDRINQTHTFTAEKVFFAIGSSPNVSNLGLENAGVKFSPSGIPVNENMQTNIPNIYACGDVVGKTLLSRVAYYHAKNATFHMFGSMFNTKPIKSYQNISKVLFTYPQLAHSGLTESEAFKTYGSKNLKIYHVDYASNTKAHLDGSTGGKAKFICTKSGILVGAHILGTEAGHLIDNIAIGQPFNHNTTLSPTLPEIHPSHLELLDQAMFLCYQHTPEKKTGVISWLTKTVHDLLRLI